MELLNKIQRELKVPKSQFNSFSKYNYRNCEDILEAVKPLLGDGVLTLSDEIVEVGGRVYVKATARLVWTDKQSADPTHTTGATVTAYAREALDKKGMDEAQITGAASSYARKYALCGLFCIDDGEDADSKDNTKPKEVAKPVPPKKVAEKRTVDKKAEIKKLIDDISLVPLFSGKEYIQYVLDNFGLDLGNETELDNIIEALKNTK